MSNPLVYIYIYIYIYIQCNPDIRELSGPENKSLISEFVIYNHIIHMPAHLYAESQRHNKDERHSPLEKYTSHFI